MQAVIGCLIGLVLSVCASAEPLLEGRVRLASGDAVASAQVQIFDMTDLQRGAVARTTTEGRGYFALPLAGLPVRFELGANYPNPFNPSTIIPYQLAASSYVRLEVFNLLGQRLATLVDGERPAGFHAAVWDATDGSGQAVGAGVYLYRLTVGRDSQTGRMVLVDGQAGVAAVGGEGVWPAGIAQDRSYGLVVSGSGIAPYVVADLGIQAGMAPVELVVAAHLAGKALGDDDFSFDLSDLFTDVTHPGRGRFQTAPYGLVGSRASRPRRGQDARDPSGNRAENQPPATYCVTSVIQYAGRSGPGLGRFLGVGQRHHAVGGSGVHLAG